MINLTVLFISFFVALASTIMQGFLSKGGNQTGAMTVGLVEYTIGWYIILMMLKIVIDMAMEMFLGGI